MKFDETNLYIAEHGEGYTINIQMPDGSRNYLHSAEYFSLDQAIADRDYLQNNNGINEHVIRIEKEGDGYYKIQVTYEKRKPESIIEFISFHSRKLNLNDAFCERMQLMITEND